MEAAARPLPKLDTTPPVTKTYFADIDATSLLNCCGLDVPGGHNQVWQRCGVRVKVENWRAAEERRPYRSSKGLLIQAVLRGVLESDRKEDAALVWKSGTHALRLTVATLPRVAARPRMLHVKGADDDLRRLTGAPQIGPQRA